MSRVELVLMLTALVAGCHGKAQPVDPAIEAAEGVPTSTLTANELNDAPALTLTPQAQISVEGEQAWRQGLAAVDVDGAGEIVIADRAAHVVRVFDTNGKPLRQFGGRSDGPGGFRRPYLVASRADTLYVVDDNGINAFTREGQYLRRAPLPTRLSGGRYIVRSFVPNTVALTDAGVVLSEIQRDGYNVDSVFQMTEQLRLVDLKSGTLGKPFQTIKSPKYYSVLGYTQWRARFGVDSHFGVLPDGSVLSNGLEGRTLNVFVDGRLTRRIVFDAPRRDVTQEELAALTASKVRYWKAGMGTTNTRFPKDFVKNNTRAAERLPYFRYHPAVGRILTSQDGRTLVQRPDLSTGTLESGGLRGATVWNLFSPDLRVIGKVELPAGFTPTAFRGDLIAGLTTDEKDVNSVSAYRLTASTPARTAVK